MSLQNAMVFEASGYEIFEELRFILELVVAEFLFALPCFKRRPRFWLRVGIGLVVLVGLSLFYFIWRHFLINDIFAGNFIAISTLVLIHYFLLTILSTVYLYLCFDYQLSPPLYLRKRFGVCHIAFVALFPFR